VKRVVITGIGVVSPCGEGREALWRAALEVRSGVSRVDVEGAEAFPLAVAGIVRGFEPSKYVSNRKSLKVMCRDIRLAVAASALARADARLGDGDIEPARSGVSVGAGLFSHELEEIAECVRESIGPDGSFDTRRFGESGMAQLFPLWLLKYLPNMPACHISIAHGLMGPSNTVTTDSASSAAAFEEAFRVIQRGSADLMFCGGAESKINVAGILRYHGAGVLRRNGDSPEYEVFTDRAAGIVPGEGGAMLILEERERALRRGAPVYAEVLGASACVNTDAFRAGGPDRSRAFAMAGALADAGVRLGDVDAVHLSATGVPAEDRVEAAALREVFGRGPRRPELVATKHLTGFLGYAAAATEIALAAMSIREGRTVPATLRGKSLLEGDFAFAGPGRTAAPRVVLVNHFAPGLSNHAVVLGVPGEPR
jgi:3-oxoacyl-[acyl-carrier-protein] synthase II